ncbi:DUF2431 domain-containing protein, partial [Cephalotus follicularis]
MENRGENVNVNIEKGDKWIKHYCRSHKILLVGEGDFSFAACLAKAFGSATNMVATSLDSKVKLKRKYSRATTNLEALEELGCITIHGVNAHIMSQHPLLNLKLFNRIVFNFPHAGFIHREEDIAQIRIHQKLMKGFFRNAYNMLAKSGQVHVTHKTGYPYSSWEIEKLAKDYGLRLVEEAPFTIHDYPGYQNKRGDGNKCNKGFHVGESSTFIFVK